MRRLFVDFWASDKVISCKNIVKIYSNSAPKKFLLVFWYYVRILGSLSCANDLTFPVMPSKTKVSSLLNILMESGYVLLSLTPIQSFWTIKLKSVIYWFFDLSSRIEHSRDKFFPIFTFRFDLQKLWIALKALHS